MQLFWLKSENKPNSRHILRTLWTKKLCFVEKIVALWLFSVTKVTVVMCGRSKLRLYNKSNRYECLLISKVKCSAETHETCTIYMLLKLCDEYGNHKNFRKSNIHKMNIKLLLKTMKKYLFKNLWKLLIFPVCLIYSQFHCSGNLRQGLRIHCLAKCCFLKDVNNSAYCSEIDWVYTTEHVHIDILNRSKWHAEDIK